MAVGDSTDLRIAGARGPRVTLLVNGQSLGAHAGEMLAAVLLAAECTVLRHSPRARATRGAFCFMGSCQECLVQVDGAQRLACRTPVADGMQVVTDA